MSLNKNCAVCGGKSYCTRVCEFSIYHNKNNIRVVVKIVVCRNHSYNHLVPVSEYGKARRFAQKIIRVVFSEETIVYMGGYDETLTWGEYASHRKRIARLRLKKAGYKIDNC